MSETFDLLDWKRRVFALYAEVRAAAEPEHAWQRWREVRAELFRDHPQSPHPGYETLAYFPYDPSSRFFAEVRHAEPEQRRIGSRSSGFTESNTSHTTSARRNRAAGAGAANENVRRSPSLLRLAST